MPNSDAAFGRLEKATVTILREYENDHEIRVESDYGWDSLKARDVHAEMKAAFLAYKEARGQEQYPAGSVVFVPDGVPRRASCGEHVRGDSGDFFTHTGWPGDKPRQIYRRIDIAQSPAPKVEKTLAQQVAMADTRMALQLICDAIDSLRAEVKAGNGAKS